MKRSSGRMLSLASMAAMLASVAAMPVSAVESNVYSVSYETLTTAITTEDGSTVPAGAVAVTMSIENNTGFNANTLTLDIDEGYSIVTDASGKPILEKGTVLAGAMTSAAVSDDDSIVCVTAASSSTMAGDGGIFTVYFTTEAAETEGFASVGSMDSNVATGECFMQPRGYVMDYYIIGDANNDDIPNALDAAEIMVAVADYGTSINNGTLGWDVLNYLPLAKHYDAPDADGNKWIDNMDASAILTYAAEFSAGNAPDGPIGNTVPFLREVED